MLAKGEGEELGGKGRNRFGKFEALAMAGTDYLEWEEEELEFPPPHLLADHEEEEGSEVKKIMIKSIDCGSSSSTSHYDHLQSQIKVLMIILLGLNFSDKRIMDKKLCPNNAFNL
ncbi:hypothetical protein Goklo_027772 [Gossypium klotzschianum]|uniref:Uncharacterized protein n=2 Tax=Gossypium TaxID=3633 RepID=A0A7J8TZA5_9ROSI|nr:hypothetical protein [Gossypium klotzschianum]